MGWPGTKRMRKRLEVGVETARRMARPGIRGRARAERGEAVDVVALRAASEWRVTPKAAAQPLWRRIGTGAGDMTMDISDEDFDDDYDTDAKREERETIQRKLGELLERLEADPRNAGSDGALPDGVGGVDGGEEDSRDGGAGVESVG